MADRHNAHGSNKGRFIRTQETVERDAEAARLYSTGLSYQKVGERLNISKWSAMDAVKRAAREVLKGPVAEVLALHASRIEWAYAKAVEIAESEHVVVSHGKIICDAEGNPLRDHGPVLSALAEARRTLESYQALFGLKQPIKIDATVTEVTQQDIELQELVRDAKARVQLEEQQIVEGGGQ
ncbi:hypothetical protein OG864_45370 [Streptomyces sp. NBC_00124]|uniref:hypothetical protein n=1 Tax=Streptomyces sp. NBC_00124 TaxID=2975662 RepID=UPI00225871E7|nr:hypothetical protein [Streptomyces sp. NBC_00124]MCX5365934.1 hypothetical protein [Streptomyces sp. NBC_00124]